MRVRHLGRSRSAHHHRSVRLSGLALIVLLALLLGGAVVAQTPAEGSGATADGTLDPGTLIYGYVFDDLDRDGVRDPEDLPLEGVAITVRMPEGTLQLPGQGTLLMPVTTDADGYYEVTIAPEDYLPGTYTVMQTTPSGYHNITPATVAVSPDADEHVQVDFADHRGMLFSGVIFEDLNRNGVRDPGEEGLAGASVVVRMPELGTLLMPVTVGDDGRYEVLVPLALTMGGWYRITAIIPHGYVETTPNPVDVYLTLGEWSQHDFGAGEPYQLWLPLIVR